MIKLADSFIRNLRDVVKVERDFNMLKYRLTNCDLHALQVDKLSDIVCFINYSRCGELDVTSVVEDLFYGIIGERFNLKQIVSTRNSYVDLIDKILEYNKLTAVINLTDNCLLNNRRFILSLDCGMFLSKVIAVSDYNSIYDVVFNIYNSENSDKQLSELLLFFKSYALVNRANRRVNCKTIDKIEIDKLRLNFYKLSKINFDTSNMLVPGNVLACINNNNRLNDILNCEETYKTF